LRPIILASKSRSRAAVLAAAGVAFEAVGSDVDEAAAKEELLARGASPRQIAKALAALKAEAVSRARPEALVIGADQTLDLDGALVDRAATLEEGCARLQALRGRRHILHAALVLAEAGRIVWRWIESPALSLRDVSDSFLASYVRRNREAVLGSVGGYHLEGEGAQLFERVEGDYFAILGLPLLPLLAELRRRGALDA
jgi:septum formation protein